MTVSTTTDAPVDLEGDLLLLPFTVAPPGPPVDALSETLGPAFERAIRDFEAEEDSARVLFSEHTVALRAAFAELGVVSELDAGAAEADVALDHEAETVTCLMPVEEAPSDARTAQGLVEGFVLAAHRYRRYETADGFNGPSAFLVYVGDFPSLHLDLAGPAFRKTAVAYRPAGGTGFGVRLLVDSLSNYVVARDRS